MDGDDTFSASLENDRAAVLAQSQQKKQHFASKLKDLGDLYAIRRQNLVHLLSKLKDEFAASKASLQQEFADDEMEIAIKLQRIDEKYKNHRKARTFAKLPAEMLGHIFEHCIKREQNSANGVDWGVSPWVFTRVCRFWRQTALGTPSLWRRILVTDNLKCYWSSIQRNTPDSVVERTGPVRLHSAIQVCVDADELRDSLRRGGAASLEITLIFCGHSGPFNHRPESAFYTRLYQALFNETISPRISHLILDSGTAWETLNSIRIEGIEELEISLSNLKYLRIYSLMPFTMRVRNEQPILKATLEGAKKLEGIYLGTNSVPEWLDYGSWKISSYGATISSLKELRVRDTHLLNTVLGGSVDLETLVIDGAARVEESIHERYADSEISSWPTSETPDITFRRLTRLHLILDDFSLLTPLKLPVLEELRLTQSHRWGVNGMNEGEVTLQNPDFSIELPNLRVLRVTSAHIAPLNRLNMPQLGSLHLTSTQGRQSKCDADILDFLGGKPNVVEVPETFSQNTFPGVKELYIDAMMSEKGLISTVKCFPSLNTLSLVPGTKIGKGLIRALTVGRQKRVTSGVTCPDLSVLQINCYAFQDWDKKEKREKRVGTLMPGGLNDAVEKLVHSREAWGKRLVRCTVLDTSGQKKEFV